MIHVPVVGQYIHARHAGEIDLRARDLIALCEEIPIAEVSVRRRVRG